MEEYKDALSKFKFVCDGEHPQRVLFERARELGIKMIEAFGMSEGVGFIFAVPRDFKTMGEILIRSAGLTEGYWTNPEKTREA